jgi:asparagine synthase (glutamine-hydrolysing)
MCGIYGAVRFGGTPLQDRHFLEGIGELLKHRGPDGPGVLESEGCVLGANRLRVRDVRSAGDQPFADPAGRLWLACNGEIYNAAGLRVRYRDYPYRSLSDVEPIVPLVVHRGPQAISDLDGMFALAIWDVCAHRLILARDRAGEKPLFYSRLGDELWFASEIGALLAHPGISRTLDRLAVDDLFTLGYVLEPRTMFANIRKVPAGSVVTISAGGEEVSRYWDPTLVERTRLSDGEAIRQLDDLLQRAISKQLVADVPVGVFTSGGVDSSLLAALAMQALGQRRLRLFTVGFGARGYDETTAATRLATHVGAEHVVLQVGAAELYSALEVLTGSTGEPITDPAVLPTSLLAQRARQDVTVVLSGEGADELFGGYPTYLGHRFANAFAHLPAAARGIARALIDAVPVSRRKVSLVFLLKRFAAAAELDWFQRHIRWFGTGLPDAARLARWLGAHDHLADPDPSDILAEAMRFDYSTYLREGLLTKLDRATMLTSLEARSPYLDRDITRFALGLESGLKVRGWTTKWLLKQVAQRWLPPRIAYRRKRGLSVPLPVWLNGELREHVEQLLAPERIARRGLLQPGLVHQLVAEHRSGRADHARALWPIIVFELWCERWLGG